MLYFITLFGLLLRLSFINKPEGLWNDEYVSWFVANTSFRDGFLQEILKQCHMPFYYFYLKPFTSCSDVVLRLTSVVPGVLAIPLMYLVGKEFSKKIGVISALITSVLSFLVYYSQEVRFYSLVFFLSALLTLFAIKLLKFVNKKYFLCYAITSVLLVFTHVLGIIFVFFLSSYLIYKKKYISKKIIMLSIIPLFLLIPLGINILKMLPSSQWWGTFSYTNILFLFCDFLTPILTNNVNAPNVFFYNKTYAFWQLAPLLVVAVPFFKGFIKCKGLAYVSIATIFLMSILACIGKLVFITKYSIEILPSIILFLAIGFNDLKKKGIVLLSVFMVLHLASFFTPFYVTKIPRTEGHRIPAEILKVRNPDKIIFTYYAPDRFERYIDLDLKKTYYVSKINRFDYVKNPQKILKNVKKGEVVSVVFLDSVSFFDENFLKINSENAKIPEMFRTFSHIKNCLVEELNSSYTSYKVDRIGSWTVITATRNK